MTLEEISARLEIQEVLARYCRGVDRGDVELLRSVYHPEAIDDHGAHKGRGYDFAPLVIERMDKSGLNSLRQITNMIFRFDSPTRARVESCYISVNGDIDPATGQPLHYKAFGRYLDIFEKRDRAWKIAHRRVLIDWSEAGTPPHPWRRIPEFLQGGRREKDPSWGFFD